MTKLVLSKLNNILQIYIVRAFANIDEDKEEENTQGTKAASNCELGSKKTKKQKQVIVCETKESESYDL